MGLSPTDFALKYGPAAIAAAAGSDIFPSVVLAAAVHESGFANSVLSNTYNNFFGIKDSASWLGKTVALPTDEYIGGVKQRVNASFRRYDSPEDSFRDYVLLVSNGRYARGGVNNATTPEQQIALIRQAGYATDPAYVSKITNIMAQLGDIVPELKKKSMSRLNVAIAVFMILAGLYFLWYNVRLS